MKGGNVATMELACGTVHKRETINQNHLCGSRPSNDANHEMQPVRNRCFVQMIWVAESISWYHGTNMKKIERTQTGLRIEKRMLKVMKGLAEHLDCSLAEVLEGMILQNFEGKSSFSENTVKKIAQLKEVYELELTAQDAHSLNEEGDGT